MVGEDSQYLCMGLGEEARGGAVHVEEANHLVPHDNRHACIRAQPRLHWHMNPSRVSGGVGDNYGFSALQHMLEVRHLRDAKDDRGDKLFGSEAFVATPAGNAHLIALDEHDVGSVVGNHPADLLQDAIQYLIEVECAGQGGRRLRHCFSQLPLLPLHLIQPGFLHGHSHLVGDGAEQFLVLFVISVGAIGLHRDHPYQPLTDQHGHPQPRCGHLHRAPQPGGRQAITLFLEVTDKEGLLLCHNNGGQPCLQGTSLRRFSHPFVYPQAEVQFLGLLVVQGDEEGIGLEDIGDLLVYCLQQVIQVENSAYGPGDVVNHRQPLSAPLCLLI